MAKYIISIKEKNEKFLELLFRGRYSTTDFGGGGGCQNTLLSTKMLLICIFTNIHVLNVKAVIYFYNNIQQNV